MEKDSKPDLRLVPKITINEDMDRVRFEGVRGEVVDLDAFRRDHELSESYFASATILHEDNSITAETVRVPQEIAVAKETKLEFIRKHKKAIEVVGAITVVVAAGSGILYRKLKK